MSSISNMEIERKYLVLDDSYKQLASSKVRISQGYLCLGDNCTVRVRRWDNKGFITIKSRANANGFARYEIEKEITMDEADILFGMCVSGTIDKWRWLVPLQDNLMCEVDEFLGDNDGLVIAEVELRKENQVFDKPAFLGPEVTTDKHYYNAYLSLHPFRSW